METPWTRANNQRRSQAQETRLGKKEGGRKQVNSGRHWFSKRDVVLGGFLIEARTTENKSYTIKREEFDEITQQAWGTPPGLLPMMVIEFPGLSLVVKREQDDDFQKRYIGELEGQVADLREQNIQLTARVETSGDS